MSDSNPVPTVHVVHCIDTEGPLHESLDATFERLHEIFGLSLEPTTETLRQLQLGEYKLDGLEAEVAKVVAPSLLNYNNTWDKIDEMLNSILSQEFRSRFQDSFGQGWIYNWHCIDFVGFTSNPRRREMGFNSIFDHYVQMLRASNSTRDGIHFHHHPVSFTREAHHSATHYFSHTPMIFEVLARRIIDRSWFPCVNRPGFHTTRPDSHWLMEQYIPFDYANQATSEDYSLQKDLSAGRFGDWRRAPISWSPYHPHHDDYQMPGTCRRWVTRCLNIGTRLRLLTEADIEHAFKEAQSGIPVILAFTNHDFRDMRPDIINAYQMISRVASRFPAVPFRFCEARDAMRRALNLQAGIPLELDISLISGQLRVTSNRPTFGPQPFLAIKTKSGQYFHDNLDFQTPFREWSYVFDEITLTEDAISAVGVGCCDDSGNVATTVLDVRSMQLRKSSY